jgi:hypothetical protein
VHTHRHTQTHRHTDTHVHAEATRTLIRRHGCEQVQELQERVRRDAEHLEVLSENVARTKVRLAWMRALAFLSPRPAPPLPALSQRSRLPTGPSKHALEQSTKTKGVGENTWTEHSRGKKYG